ncbi:hypothetical protein MF410_31875 (plasmid) [Rhizobium sp. C104]|uniref:hypothetical protein n=1 Tax=Rhizobium sp. C104 TaxID=2917727 RepID=UPI001EF7EFCA|nr:hypothetical protein [Rhizobium sp. C104]ULJ81995.1 hypothetical protein MF410_31875 [Rhizobium sp. C104]
MDLAVNFADDHWPLLIAEYDFPTRVLTTYPIWLRSNQSNFTKTKYGAIKRISFEDQPPMDFQVGFGMLLDLPTGFHRGPFEGFGVDPRIRYIISAFDEVEGVAGLTICNDHEISIDGEEIRLPEHIYQDVRLDINRAHEAAVRFANGEKVSYLRNRLLPSVVPDFEPDDFERPALGLIDIHRSQIIAARR